MESTAFKQPAAEDDGVDAEVLYPTPRLSGAIIANQDAEYHVAMVRAYNDWLSEMVGYAPERLCGVALLPNRGVEEAVAEVASATGLPRREVYARALEIKAGG